MKGSGDVDMDSFLPQKVHTYSVRIYFHRTVIFYFYMCTVQGYIQVTYVEPYFDDWELKHRKTVFDRSFNIRKSVSPNIVYSNTIKILNLTTCP